MKKPLKRTLTAVLAVFCAVLLVVITYVAYVMISYKRLPDNLPQEVEGTASQGAVSVGEEYVIATQNLGFGAYTADYTFFLDGGKQSRAASKESVISCISAGMDTVEAFDCDFIFFQEIDLNSTRSYHVNQYDMLKQRLTGYSTTRSVNYDSAYLFYPIFSPHGKSYSSIVTASRFTLTSSLRRSLPISTSFSKFLDLDRCYTISRVQVEDGKELVLFNVHTSAYGGDDSIRTAQVNMFFADMQAEYEKGNYVICGGDFNHDFTGDATMRLNGGEDVEFGWAQPFPEELIPEGFSRAINYEGELIPTCRNCDVPYKPGNFTTVVDGFILSDNVTCISVENVDTGFAYADHNPVKLVFKLN